MAALRKGLKILKAALKTQFWLTICNAAVRIGIEVCQREQLKFVSKGKEGKEGIIHTTNRAIIF